MLYARHAKTRKGGGGREGEELFRLSGNAAQFLCGSLFVATLSPGLASNIFLFGRFCVYFLQVLLQVLECDTMRQGQRRQRRATPTPTPTRTTTMAMWRRPCIKFVQLQFVIKTCSFLSLLCAAFIAHSLRYGRAHTHMPVPVPHASWHMPRAPV